MNSTHRQASRAKHAGQNPLLIAMMRVSTLTVEERAQRVKPYRTALQHLQFGGFCVDDWRHLADACNFGEVFAHPPFNLANDHAATFTTAQLALEGLADQHRRIGSWTARAHQLQFAGLGEIMKAEQLIINRIQGALSNGSAILVEPMQ